MHDKFAIVHCARTPVNHVMNETVKTKFPAKLKDQIGRILQNISPLRYRTHKLSELPEETYHQTHQGIPTLGRLRKIKHEYKQRKSLHKDDYTNLRQLRKNIAKMKIQKSVRVSFSIFHLIPS